MEKKKMVSSAGVLWFTFSIQFIAQKMVLAEPRSITPSLANVNLETQASNVCLRGKKVPLARQ